MLMGEFSGDGDHNTLLVQLQYTFTILLVVLLYKAQMNATAIHHSQLLLHGCVTRVVCEVGN